MLRSVLTAGACVAFALVAGCAATTGEEEAASSSDEALSTRIYSSYGMTMFGGSGDYQRMSCGLSSRAAQQSNPYYVASSQRYGCKVHLKLTTRDGRCVVASTEDAGPATWVERKAGVPILDASPATVKALFPGVGSIGWTDLKRHPGTYDVTATRTTLPLGPCDGADDGAPDNAGSSSGGPAENAGAPCSTDGECNPGSDGSGMICEQLTCVPGCRTNAQCGGNTRCVDGQCE